MDLCGEHRNLLQVLLVAFGLSRNCTNLCLSDVYVPRRNIIIPGHVTVIVRTTKCSLGEEVERLGGLDN